MSAGDWKDLYQAAVSGDMARVKYHLSEGVNPNYQHPEILRTLLVASLLEGQPEVVQELLANGADPNLVSELDDLTPLQAARRSGGAMVDALLAHGAREPKPSLWRRWLLA